MGKGGRAACIFTPMALTVASFVCVLLINLGGINKNSATLNDLYFFQADFSNFSTGSNSSSALSIALEAAVSDGYIADFYQIHLWNYCNGTDSSSNSTKKVTWCSTRKTDFVFDPLDVWNLESALNSTASSAGVSSSVVSELESDASDLEDELLDKSARDALKTYKKVAKWMFIAYFVGLWALIVTIVLGVFAVCTRFISFLTWIVSIIATVLVTGATVTATILFTAVIAGLKSTLDDYNITLTLSKRTLGVSWLASACTIIATLFWLFSCCCCSGRSNPHHVSNREPAINDFKQGGFHWGGRAAPGGLVRGRSLKVEKTGGNYERVESPYTGQTEGTVPLNPVHRGGQGEAASYYAGGHDGAYEPYRHG